MKFRTYTAFLVPLSVAFNEANGNDVNAFWIIDYVGSLIYVVDIFIEFHVGFIVRWESSCITIQDGPSVAWHYFRHGTFWIDFVATLPVIGQIILSTEGAKDVSATILHALTLLKLLRLLRVFKVLRNMNKMDKYLANL